MENLTRISEIIKMIPQAILIMWIIAIILTAIILNLRKGN